MYGFSRLFEIALLAVIITAKVKASDEKPGECPSVEPGTVGICVEKCSSDADCPDDQKCCSNGCGHVCMDPVLPSEPEEEPDEEPEEEEQSSKKNKTVEKDKSQLEVVEKPGLCPPVLPGTFGICVEACRTDADCPGIKKCCSNGCGHVCMDPILVPVEPEPDTPAQCPQMSENAVGLCNKLCDCNNDCPTGQICCSNGCGQQCLKPCSPLKCDNDCPYGYKTRLGCPICSCKDPCDDFKCAKDEECRPNTCNKPPCQPPAVCVSVCELPLVTGPCKGHLKRYYYDETTKTCQSFIYGGCRGNGNNFKTKEDCLNACSPCEEIKCPFKCPVPFPTDERGCQLGCDCDVCQVNPCKDDLVCVVEPGPCQDLLGCLPEAKCVDGCTLPVKPGPCKGSFTRYYFDMEELICKAFIYGGCAGNENNFLTLDQCNDACFGRFCPEISCKLKCNLKKDEKTGCEICECEDPCQEMLCPEGQVCTIIGYPCLNPPCEPIAKCIEICELPPKHGPCEGNIVRYYFDAKEKLCKKFTYGGCEPNANNFEKLEKCIELCLPDCPPIICPLDCEVVSSGNKCPECNCDPPNVCKDYECDPGEICVAIDVVCVTAPCLPIPQCISICELPKIHGPCSDSLARYYFDAESKRCKPFIYGGCEGNENNFETIGECLQACAPDVCSLPKDPGPCDSVIPRFYYEDGRCKSFLYGGCDGNANNFRHLSDCISVCDKDCEPIDCPLNCLIILMDGCYGCRCDAASVCQGVQCPKGEVCIPQEVWCVTAPCPPVPTCVPYSELHCDLHCELKTDQSGQEICECKDPCEVTKCEEGYACVVVSEPCSNTSCTGYKAACADIDECALCLDDCEDDEQCVNTHGSFTCAPAELEFPCVCYVQGDPMVETYDKTLKLIFDEQKTLLSRGMNPDESDRCKFQSRVQTDDDYPGKEGQVYVEWAAFSFGIHPNKTKFLRAIQIFQDKVLIRGHGVIGGVPVSLPYTYTTDNNPSGDPVTVRVTEYDDTVVLESIDCPWKLEFVRGGFNSKVRLAVGARYKPSNNNGQNMDGICGNCDGNFDYVLCGADRVDVSQEEDKYQLISESCAEGKHQHHG